MDRRCFRRGQSGVTLALSPELGMPDDLASILNLNLALTRVIGEITSAQTFFRHPHELDLIGLDRAGWLASLRSELATFVPGDLYLCNAVKPKGTVRPGGILSVRDQTVYAALVGALSEQIRASLDWHSEHVDFSYPISPRVDDPRWFANFFPLWRSFAEESIRRIDDWAEYVVLVDITAYYENIDIGLLLSDLRGIGSSPVVLEALSKCLNKWSQAAIPGRSVPQGFGASNILARFYLNRVDRALRERGVNHLRYVDDMRLFCRTKDEAKRQFVELIVLLRKRGLAVQTAKSEIVTADEAKDSIQGLLPALYTILQDFVDSIRDLFGVTNPYFNLADAEQMLEANPDSAPIGLIREAYRRFFLQNTDGRFDRTLFHFLLRRLARAGDEFAVDHSLTLVQTQPQETTEVLYYLGKLERAGYADTSLLDYLSSPNAVYPHQFYEVFQWRLRQAPPPPVRFLALVRTVLFERPAPPYLRSVCREFLARFGTDADLERLHDSLLVTAEDLERAELLCSLRRMEPSRRNGILSRYAHAGPYTDRAITLVRSGWNPGA
jgi:hypothetical protein